VVLLGALTYLITHRSRCTTAPGDEPSAHRIQELRAVIGS